MVAMTKDFYLAVLSKLRFYNTQQEQHLNEAEKEIKSDANFNMTCIRSVSRQRLMT